MSTTTTTRELDLSRIAATFKPGCDFPSVSRGDTVTLTRDLPNRSRIVATLEIRHPFEHSRLSPGFSLTGEVYEASGTWSGAACQRNGREPSICGQVHDYVLRAFPFLAAFERVHLAGLDGVPMHAGANATYYYPREDVRGWVHSARKACADAERFTSSGVYHGELIHDGETIDGQRHYANRWSADGTWSLDAIPAVKVAYQHQADQLGASIGDVVTIGARSWRDIAHARAARAFGVEPDDLPTGLDPAGLAAFVADQRERWTWEAHDARTMFETLRAHAIDGQVAAILRTDNPGEAGGEWSTYDVARGLDDLCGFEDWNRNRAPRDAYLDQAAESIARLCPGGGRYVGGTSVYLYHLPYDTTTAGQEA